MVVEGGVQVEVAAAGAGLVLAAGRAAENLVAAAVGDAAEFLHVDVDQLAGPVAFVAAHGFAGGPVQVGKAGQAVTVQDAVGGGGGDAASGGKPQRSDAVLSLQADDLLLDRGRGAVGLMVGWLERSCRPAVPCRR